MTFDITIVYTVDIPDFDDVEDDDEKLDEALEEIKRDFDYFIGGTYEAYCEDVQPC